MNWNDFYVEDVKIKGFQQILKCVQRVEAKVLVVDLVPAIILYEVFDPVDLKHKYTIISEQDRHALRHILD